MRFFRFTLLLCFLQIGFVYAQVDLDKEINAYQNGNLDEKMERAFVFYSHLDQISQDTVIYYVDDLQSRGIEQDRPDATALSNYVFVTYLYEHGLYDQAIQKLTDSEKFYLDTKNDSMLAVVNNAYGNIAYLQGNVSEALSYYKKAYDYGEKVADLKFKMLSSLNIARMYIQSEEYDEAEQLIQDYITFTNKEKQIKKVSNGYNLLGKLYAAKENFKKAKFFWDKGMGYALSSGDKRAISDSYTNMAIAEYFEENLAKAESYFKLALAYRLKEDDHFKISEAYYNLGDFYYGQEKLDSAKSYYERSYNDAKISKSKSIQVDALTQISAIYDTLGQNENQIQTLKEIIRLNGIIAENRNKRDLKALNISHEKSVQKAALIGEVREKKLNNQVSAYDSIFNQWLWIVIVCILSLVIIFMVRKNKKEYQSHDKKG